MRISDWSSDVCSSDLANQGKWHDPTLIDFVQDRHGKVIWPANWRACAGCNAPDWNGKPMPRPQIRTRQAVDPLTAYQMVLITEGVVERGTARTLRDRKSTRLNSSH